MKVRDVMTTDVKVIACEGTLRQAAEMMRACDFGSLPVSRDQRLVGMLTDRDIVVRAVAEGLGGDCPVSKVMSEDLKFCYDDQSVEEAASRMSDLGVRRLPVVDRQERLVGFMSLSNVASADNECATEDLLEGTAKPH
jgi:CBS domain-containing protein